MFGFKPSKFNVELDYYTESREITKWPIISKISKEAAQFITTGVSNTSQKLFSN